MTLRPVAGNYQLCICSLTSTGSCVAVQQKTALACRLSHRKSCSVQDAGFNMAFKPIRVKFKPSAKDVQVCEESGVDLAQAVHRVMRVQERQAGSSQVKTGMLPFFDPSSA